MSVRTLSRTQWLPRPRAEVFAFFQNPANLAKLMPGEMSSLLLGSLKIVPAAAAGAGYQFKHPRLEDALAATVR